MFFMVLRIKEFQSTCPMKGKTQKQISNINIAEISIHLPYEGQDDFLQTSLALNPIFQSTCPMKGKTNLKFPDIVKQMISIHLPYEGQDVYTDAIQLDLFSISIHLPYEGQDGENRAVTRTHFPFFVFHLV